MDDELWDELFAVVCAKRMNVNTSLGKEEGLTDALMPIVERRVADAKAEAWDEGERHESEYLATWGQFCPNPENPYRVVSRG